MPIITDKKKFSFMFYYEWEGEEGQKLTFPIKYLYGTYGPTIQVYFGEGEGQQGVELPADIFGEVANFLVQQGIIAPSMAQQRIPAPVGGGKPMGVPLLRGATGMTMPHRQPQNTSQIINPLDQGQTPSFNPLAPRAQEASVQPPNHGEVPSLSNEEIMAARLAAKEKAAANSVTHFRKGHREGEYTPPPKSAARRAAEAANAIEEENRAE